MPLSSQYKYERTQPKFAARLGLGWNLKYMRSPNQGSRKKGYPVDTIILHHTACDSYEMVADIFLDTEKQVSSHYLISRASEGNAVVSTVCGKAVEEMVSEVSIFVQDDKRAWHAGLSHWGGRNGLNDYSIGIEINNEGTSEPFGKEQMAALIVLLYGLVKAYSISPFALLSHHEIAPSRKVDPSDLFDWKMLAHYGLGYFPQSVGSDAILLKEGSTGPAVVKLQTDLIKWGYGYVQASSTFDATTTHVVESFQRRYAPSEYQSTALKGSWTDHDSRILAELLSAKAAYEMKALNFSIDPSFITAHNPLASYFLPYETQLQEMGLGYFVEDAMGVCHA